MSMSMNRFGFVVAAALLYLAAPRPALAGSAIWSSNPLTGDWNTAANWIPTTVPNAPSDIATFSASSLTDLFISTASVEVDSAIFSSGAPVYTITLQIYNITFSGAGIVNNSGVVQSFVAPTVNNNDADIFFYNNATAGEMTSFSTVGGIISFNDQSSAGSASFDLTDSLLQADLFFWDSTTAANAIVTASRGALIGVYGAATAANAQFTTMTESVLYIAEDATADHATATCIGGDQYFGAGIAIQENASAGEGTFTAIGASSSDEKGAYIELSGNATADRGTFTINGGMGAGLAGTSLTFFDTTTAANANIIASGGVGGADGGAIIFTEQSKGAKANISLSGNAELDISTHNAPGVTIGSLSGTGSVLLGARVLTIGSNNQSTTFSGVIQDSGGVNKRGTGTLTLAGNNLYIGNTTVSGGVLEVSNRRGSGTGTGSVNVQAGTLAGKGIISGAVTIGTGSGAFLAPSIASNQPAILTCQNTLTFKADSAYTYKLNTMHGRADQVRAKGVTIESGAQFDFNAVANKRLTTGTVFIAISNTSANPIGGTFANLPDNSTFTVGRNNYQASYSGGDGNDLTLTVVP
jgi:autotransporter-associated beta strand protein